jgi:dienelactone hydrolase
VCRRRLSEQGCDRNEGRKTKHGTEYLPVAPAPFKESVAPEAMVPACGKIERAYVDRGTPSMDAMRGADDDVAIATRSVKLAVGGASRTAFLAVPKERAWKAAVVVVGDRSSVDAEVKEVARGLAREGHGALALGHGQSGPEGTDVVELTRGVDAALSRLRGEAPAPPPRIGVVGYGAGGFIALVAGYRCQVGAVVSVYGEGPMRLRAELRRIIDRPKRHAAPFLCLLGGEDDAVRPGDLAAIRERLHIFGMRHTFIIYPRTRGEFCRVGGLDYRASEAADAWGKILHALDTAPRLRNRSPPNRRG